MTPPSSASWSLYGYPGSVGKPGFTAGEQWGMTTGSQSWGGTVIGPDPTWPDWGIYHQLDSSNGQSGSCVYYSSGSYKRCIGGNTHHGNFAPRLGVIWVPFIDTNSTYNTTHSWGSNSSGI